MLRLETLSAFVRVAELSSFSRAAESLGMPRASVSTAVKALEEEVGAQLLYRTTRRVQLTYDGQVFYQRCKDLLADVDELGAMFETSPEGVTGRIRIDMPVAMAVKTITPRLPAFLAAHPGLSVELSSSDRMVDVVREGFDCVLRIGGQADSGLIARTVGHMDMVSCASPAYLERHGVPRTLDDLAGHVMVHYVLNIGARPFGFEYFDGESYRTIAMKGALTVNNTQVFETSALCGLGIIQAPRLGVAPHLASGALVELLPGFPPEPLPVALVYPQRRHLARRVKVFIDWAADVIAAEIEAARAARRRGRGPS